MGDRRASYERQLLDSGEGNLHRSSTRSELFKFGTGFVVASVVLDLQQLSSVTSINPGNVLLIAVALLLLVHALRRSDKSSHIRLMGHDWAYLVSAGVMLGSITWSVSPRATIMATVPLIVVWIASLLLCRLSVEEAIQIVLVVALIAGLVSLAVVPILGDAAFQPASSTGAPELRGIFRHQLRLGAFMALALGLLVIARLNRELPTSLRRSPALMLTCFTLLSLILWLSRTRLYVGAALLALLLTLLLSRRGSRRWIAVCVLVTAAVPIIDGFNTILERLEEAGFDTGLTGRARTWTRAIRAVDEDSQWFGYGFGTFELPDFDYLFPGVYRPVHAHSSFIQAYFETGLLGLTVLIILIFAQAVVGWRYSVRCNKFSYSLFLVFYNAIGSLTGLNYAGSLTAMFCIMMLFLAIESRAQLEAGRPDKAGSRQA